jgi:16S rRNA (cytosine967-C5)-methyltransferase
MRWMGAAEALREQLVARRPEPSLDALLLCALALLWPAGGQPYAAHTLVDESVKAARRLHARHGGFVNAVLRRYLREQPALHLAVQEDARALTNHPAWWVRQLHQDWGPRADDLLLQAQQHPPMALRVNTRKIAVAQYAALLSEQGLAHTLSQHPTLDQLILLAQPVPVTRLPGFADGWVSVQDVNAQRAAAWLLSGADSQGWRVLDACAAPGGKTAHLLERADLDLLALDSDAQRLGRVTENLQRLGLSAELKVADAADLPSWWDGHGFDAILLDAPCSASGIVRRHPDIRWLRRAGDIPTLAATQLRLLQSLWSVLKPGGRLLYATCSVFKAEGQDVIDAFLQRIGGAASLIQPGSPGHLLPLPQNEAAPDDVDLGLDGDGFFYALLAKPPAAAAAAA